jgi:hypothetical protein
MHHPLFGEKLKERMDAAGVACEVVTGVTNESNRWPAIAFAFIQKHLGPAARPVGR